MLYNLIFIFDISYITLKCKHYTEYVRQQRQSKVLSTCLYHPVHIFNFHISSNFYSLTSLQTSGKNTLI